MQSSPANKIFAPKSHLHIAGKPGRLLTLSFVLLLICFGSVVRGQDAANAVAPPANPTVEDYCRLTISLMQRSVEEWQERVPVAERVKTDRKKLETALQAVTKKYRDQRSEEYKQFGFDQRTFLHYATDHKTEIESYLEDNPEVQQAINDLKKQIEKLIEQFESAVSPHPQGGEK